MSIKVKKYSETPGGPNRVISGSILEVEMTSPKDFHHYREFCTVCPNRLKKMTGVDMCEVINFDVSRFTDSKMIKDGSVTCRHGLAEIYNNRRTGRRYDPAVRGNP